MKSVCKGLAADPQIIDAIIIAESAYDPFAIRYEVEYDYVSKAPDYAKINQTSVATEIIGQKISWGLGQVMGGTARGLGYKLQLPMLCDPTVNIELMIEFIQQLEAKYKTLDDVIASYNAGIPRKLPTGFYRNQQYVDKVHEAMTVYKL